MKKLALPILALLVAGCSSRNEVLPNPHGLEISEVTPSKETAITKQNLHHLAQVYDLTPFLFAKKIEIHPAPTPSSTTVLSVSTKYAQDPHKLLSQWLHEELHWWARMNARKMSLAITDLKRSFPTIPPEKRPGDNYTGYAHLLVCYLELEALAHFIGRRQAQSIVASLAKDDHLLPWAYGQVLSKNEVIRKIVVKHELLPPSLI